VDTEDLDGFAMEPLGLLYDYSRKIPFTDAYPRVPNDYRQMVSVYGLYAGNQVELWADASDVGSDVREYSVSGPIELLTVDEDAYVLATQLVTEGTPDLATVYATMNFGSRTEEVQASVMVMDTGSEPMSISVEKNPDAALERGEHFDGDSNELEIQVYHFADWDGLEVYRNSDDRIDAVYFQVADQYGVVSQFDPARYAILYDDVEDRNGIAIGASSGILSIDETRLARGDRFRIRATADNEQSLDLIIVLK
jgi:hypothetical protein